MSHGDLQRLGGLLGPAVAVGGLASLTACVVSPAAVLWGIGLFVVSVVLFQGWARSAPGTGSQTGSPTETSATAGTATSSATETGTTGSTSTGSEMGSTTTESPSSGTDTWGPCLSRPHEPEDDDCVSCSANQNEGSLLLLAPMLLAVAPRRRRHELIERLAADKALPADVVARLRRG